MLIEFELVQTHQLQKCRAVLKGTFPRRLLMEMCDTVCLSDEVISDIPTLVELSNFQPLHQVIIHFSDFAYYMQLYTLIFKLKKK